MRRFLLVAGLVSITAFADADLTTVYDPSECQGGYQTVGEEENIKCVINGRDFVFDITGQFEVPNCTNMPLDASEDLECLDGELVTSLGEFIRE